MTHPVFHAQSSVRLWGGTLADYQPIHDWLDGTKEMFADFRHRALRHHAHGIFEAERMFGHAITNSDGHIVPVRYIAEQHIKEDCGGRIPTVADWLSQLKPAVWMSRGYPVDARDFEIETAEGRQTIPMSPAAAELEETLSGLLPKFEAYIIDEPDDDIRARNLAWLEQARRIIAMTKGGAK